MSVHTPICHDGIGSMLEDRRPLFSTDHDRDPLGPNEADQAAERARWDRVAGCPVSFPQQLPRVSVFDAAESYSSVVRIVTQGDVSAVNVARRFASNLVAAYEATDGQFLPDSIRIAYESAARLLGKMPAAATN